VPTYQYACTECGHQLEAVQSFSDDPLTVCPACEGRLRKLYSAVGIVFKGSGFYRTDSRTAPKSEPAKSEPAKSEAAAATGSPSDSGSGKAAKGAESASGNGSSGTSSASTTKQPATTAS
jgi:putative FmdB family regulatory protein